MQPRKKYQTSEARPSGRAPYAERRPRPATVKQGQGKSGGALFVGLLALVLLAYGWWGKSSRTIDPETGLGYWLGIAGLTCVGILLLYPLAKRIRFFRKSGAIPAWFSIHMLMGVAAPILILYHSNFSLGSLNATIALSCMLIVSASGVVGRFLYVRVHRDMSGRQAEARSMIETASAQRLTLQQMFGFFPDWIDTLEGIEDQLSSAPKTMFHAIWRGMMVSNQVEATRKGMRKKMRQMIAAVPRKDPVRRSQLRSKMSEMEPMINAYSRSIRDAARLAVYERLFALWHILHLPLFFLMLLAAIIHVVAVHQY